MLSTLAMALALINPVDPINVVRNEPVEVGHCITKYAKEWAANLVAESDIYHGLVVEARRGCNKEWIGQIIIRSDDAMTVKESIPFWLASPPHRDVLLNSKAKKVGVGRAFDNNQHVIVINFATKSQ